MVKPNIHGGINKMFESIIIVVAHRGFSAIYPENTVLSFRKAIELGVDFIELDVRQTKDNEIIVLHDEKIDRTTDGSGFVKEMTYKEIQRYDAGRWKGYSGEKIPHLKEVFEAMDSNTRILIEIKQCDTEKLIKVIDDCNFRDRVFVGSFNLEYVKQIRNISPEIVTSLISSSIPENLIDLIISGIKKIDISFKCLTRITVKNLLFRGFIINGWTPDTEEDIIKTIQTGVQFITTNRPDILKNILSKNEEV